jgi:uncharacterized delta-60 repeat protein
MRFVKVIFVLALVSSSSFSQQAGDFDQSFGTNGIVITDVTDSSARDEAYSIAMHPFGHIYAAGTTLHYEFFPPWGWMSLVKYNPDGSKDPSFGENGRVFEYSFGAQTYCSDVEFYGNNQSVVMTGWRIINNTSELLVYRYDQFGQRDNSFGNNGEVVLPFINNASTEIAVQFDGKILIGGYLTTGGNTEFFLCRLNIDGSLDNTFNNDGYIVGGFSSSTDLVSNLVIQPDSKILVTVSSQNATIQERMIRFNPDGSYDSAFGVNGIVDTDFRDINSIAVTTDGKIITACTDTAFQFLLLRYNSDGSLDGSFNSGNPVVTSTWFAKLGIQFDGKIVGSGSEYQMGYLIERFNEDGSYDNTFGNNGSVRVNLTANGDIAYDLFLQNDRKILAAGVAWNDGLDRDFGLVRLLSNPIAPNTPVQIGDGLNNLSYYNFTNLGLPAVEQVTAVPFPNSLPPNLPGDTPLTSAFVNRYYDLIVSPDNAGTSSNYSATLRLYYSDDEVIAIDESKLKLIRYNGLGWDYVGGSVNTVENYVEASDITKFNIFAFADPDSITLDVEDELYGLNEYQLDQNYPNPFNPMTNIQFRTADFGFVSLKVYDVLGNEVALLINEEKVAGIYEVDFNAVGLSSGIYFYELKAGSFVETKKMILMK